MGRGDLVCAALDNMRALVVELKMLHKVVGGGAQPTTWGAGIWCVRHRTTHAPWSLSSRCCTRWGIGGGVEWRSVITSDPHEGVGPVCMHLAAGSINQGVPGKSEVVQDGEKMLLRTSGASVNHLCIMIHLLPCSTTAPLPAV